MAESGEMDEVIDAVLSHAKQGIIRVYNQFKYDAQKQAALDSCATLPPKEQSNSQYRLRNPRQGQQEASESKSPVALPMTIDSNNNQ